MGRIQPTLHKVAEIWKKYPDFRLGQLILAITMTDEHNPKLFYMEDDVLKAIGRKKSTIKEK